MQAASLGILSLVDGYVSFFERYGVQLVELTVDHIFIITLAIVLAVPVGVTVGVLISFNDRAAQGVIWVAGIMETIPSLALFALLIPIIGIGIPPVIVGLFLYSQLPIVRNTYIGLTEVDPAAIEAARGLGMTTTQQLRIVQFPRALPLLMGGVRNAIIILIGGATIGAFIGAGGLGDFIFRGIRNGNFEMILITAVVLSLLSLTYDYVFDTAERLYRERNGEPTQSNRAIALYKKHVA